jgi:TrmH family RNA methyltransferase
MGKAGVITSAQNPKLKLARALMGRPRERREANAFVIEGVRLIEDAFAAGWQFRFALYSDGLSERGQDLVNILIANRIDIEEVSGDLLQKVSETETPQGILAVLEFTKIPMPPYPTFVLIPDQIRDPGNLGTLLRTAAATGVQAVLLPPETTDAFAPKVMRAGMGAHFRLPIHEMTWPEIREHTSTKHPLMSIYLADMHGETCWESDLRRSLALIIGSEAEGASQDARSLATHQISIPMAGHVESLNAGVAGSVLMFEVVRQRKYTALIE